MLGWDSNNKMQLSGGQLCATSSKTGGAQYGNESHLSCIMGVLFFGARADSKELHQFTNWWSAVR